MYKSGDLVEYSGILYFVVTEADNSNQYVICPVNKIDLFGSESDRIKSFAKYSMRVSGHSLEAHNGDA